MSNIETEFEFKLRNGSVVVVQGEALVYRDEFDVAWIENLKVSFSIMETKHWVDAANCLQLQLGEIKGDLEDRLVETFDEQKKEAS